MRRSASVPVRAAATSPSSGFRVRVPVSRRVFLVVFLHLLAFTMGGPILPALRSHFSVAPAQFGLINSVFPLGMFMAVFLFPSLSDRIGRKPVLEFCLFAVGLGFVMQGLVIHLGFGFGAFLLLRFLSGCCAGSSTVLKAYIADVADENSLPKAMAYRQAAGTLSYIVGPTLASVLFALFGLPFVVVFGGMCSVLAACVIFAFFPSAQAPAEEEESDTTTSPTKGEKKSKWTMDNRIAVGVMITLHFMFSWGQAFNDSFFTLFARDRFGLRPAVLGPILTAAASFGFMNSVLVYPWLCGRFRSGKRATVYLTMLGQVLLVLGLVTFGFSTSLGMAAFAVACYSCGVAYFTPGVPTMLAQRSPSRQRGFILGLDSAVALSARFISPTVMGLVYQTGPAKAFSVAGAVVAVGVFLAYFSRHRLLSGDRS